MSADEQRRWAKAIKPGETIDEVYLVSAKDLRTTRSGDYYLSCTLCDRTGQVAGRMWQVNEALFASIPLEGFLHVKGRAEDYRGKLQIIIDACRPFPREKADLSLFLAVSDRDTEEMWQELLEALRAVKDADLRRLIKKFVEDHDFVAAFKRAPAAMQMHHPFLGGLLEHTTNVMRAAKLLLPMYPRLNADLVLAGSFFHDMGKAAELRAATGISYTDRGQLVGHITIAAIWLERKADELSAELDQPFPRAKLDLLQHIVLSHHGVHEYGSPKLPAVPEAFFIHYLDNLDAKMFMTVRDIDADADPAGAFTGYNRDLGTRLYKRSTTWGERPDQDDDEDSPPLFSN